MSMIPIDRFLAVFGLIVALYGTWILASINFDPEIFLNYLNTPGIGDAEAKNKGDVKQETLSLCKRYRDGTRDGFFLLAFGFILQLIGVVFS